MPETAMTDFKVVTLQQRPELEERFWPQKERIWPEFMFHDVYANQYWHYLGDVFNAFQLFLLNEQDEPIAIANTIPCTWDGTLNGLPVGWAETLVSGARGYADGRNPNTLSALEISIKPEYRAQGVSYQMIKAVRALAAEHDLQAVIVAVRPSMKSRYPITPMERYARWQRADGTPFDPWLRAHWRSGGEILKVAHPSMVIEGTVQEWQEWTGMQFPESGDYIIAEALVPIQIDLEMNVGRYIEPNIWVHHPITTARLKP
jgi:hypothetical protein